MEPILCLNEFQCMFYQTVCLRTYKYFPMLPQSMRLFLTGLQICRCCAWSSALTNPTLNETVPFYVFQFIFRIEVFSGYKYTKFLSKSHWFNTNLNTGSSPNWQNTIILTNITLNGAIGPQGIHISVLLHGIRDMQTALYCVFITVSFTYCR